MPKPKTLNVKSLKGFVPYKGAPKTCAEMETSIQFKPLTKNVDPKIGLAMLDKLDKRFEKNS